MSGSAGKYNAWFLILATLLLFLPSLNADFVFDDHYLIENNPYFDSTAGIRAAFTSDYYGLVNPQYSLGYYRPFTILSHWLDWQVWNGNAFGHHLTNLILHLCTVFLLHIFLRKLFANEPLAFLSSLIFALHPSHVSSVTSIASRDNVLAAFFSLLTLFVFLQKKIISSLPYFGALLCKEISVTTPALAFWGEKEKSWRSAFLWMIPFVVVLIVVAVMRRAALGTLTRNPLQLSFEQILQGILLIPTHLRFLVFPPIQLYFEPNPHTLPVIVNIASLLVFGAGLILLRNRKIVEWSLVWLITLLPVLGLVRLETKLDERFLYFPSISFCLLAGAWLVRYLEYRTQNRTIATKHLFAVGIVVSLIYAPFLIVKQSYWKNDLSLWKSVLETDPSSSTNRFRLGVAYLQSGYIKEAENEFITGLKLPQESRRITAVLYTHLGIAKQLLKKADVETMYRKALEIQPDYFSAHFNLGLYYKQSGRIDDAIKELEAALKANPNSDAARKNLTELLQKK